jgi:hypothetical protein
MFFIAQCCKIVVEYGVNLLDGGAFDDLRTLGDIINDALIDGREATTSSKIYCQNLHTPLVKTIPCKYSKFLSFNQ